MRAGCDLGADLGEVRAGGLGADMRQDESGRGAAVGADGAEQPDGVMTVVARDGGSCAALGPDVGERALLADAGLVLEPDLDRLVARRRRQDGRYEVGEVFLNASCAARSRCG